MSAVGFRGVTLLVVSGLLAIGSIGAAGAKAEQSTPPPIHGVTGTIATDESVNDVSRAGRGLMGKIARLFGLNRGDSARTEDAAADETFRQLVTGGRVVIQEATATSATLTADEIDRLHDEGARQTDAVVMAVDRASRTITIRLGDDGSRQTLRLIGQADGAAAPERRGGGRTVVILTGAAGERVVLLFAPVSPR
jgi:hypothetical protein